MTQQKNEKRTKKNRSSPKQSSRETKKKRKQPRPSFESSNAEAPVSRKRKNAPYPKKKQTGKQKKSPPKTKKSAILHGVWNGLFYVIMLSILVGSSLMAVMQQQNKSFNGYRMFGVLTNSMVSPGNIIKPGGFRAGDILITKEVDPSTIKKGDVITYRPSINPTNASTNFLTHRVVNVSDYLGDEEGLFFTTRGDANQSDDMPISSTALIGKEIIVIPKVAGMISIVKENWLVSIVFITSLLGFIWVMRSYIFTGTAEPEPQKQRPRKKKSAYDKYGISSSEVNIDRVKIRRKQK